MDLSQRAASIDNNKNSAKKDPEKIMIYRLKSNHLDSVSNQIDKNLIAKMDQSKSSKIDRIMSELNS